MTTTEISPEVLSEPGLLIGDEWLRTSSGGWVPHVNPATGKEQANVLLAGEQEVADAVDRARSALPAWRSLPPAERRNGLLRIASLLRDRAPHFGQVATLEIGTPQSMALVAALGAAEWFTYYAGWVDKLNGEVVAGENFSYTVPEPFGVVAAIVPWNAPLIIAGQKLAPALASGNCVILKPPELAPFACLDLGQLCLDAGLPPGVLQVLPGGPEAGDALVRHPGVDKVTFTGGTAVGRKVAAAAGEALKPVVVELGGKSANLLFEDANLDEAVSLSVGLISVFAGQGCALPTRLLVQRSVYDEVLERSHHVAAAISVGDPANPATAMGPVISAGQCARIEGIIEQGVSSGAGRLLTGGKRLEGDLASGYFIPPTLFADVDNRSDLAQEEIFGPVLAIIPFDEEDEAIAIANDSPYGLAGYVQTNDLRRAHRVASQIDAGFISINSFPWVTPATPFGGFGASGFGKEGGHVGIAEFLRTKNVTYVAMTVQDLWYDPYDEAIDRHPHPIWRRLRDEAPIYWNEAHQFFCVSRYHDVLEVLLDPETFSSAYGTVLEVMTKDPFPLGGMLIFTDPPQHTRLRGLVNRAFTQRRIAQLTARIEQVCAELLEPHVGDASFDYLGQFGNLLPPTLVLSFLGFPDGHADEWRAAMTSRASGRGGADVDGATEQFILDMQHEESVFALLPDLCRRRRLDPEDDLVTVLVHAELDDGSGATRRLSDEEISTFVHMLAIAGSDTVAKFLGWAAVLLARHPDQRRLLVEDEALIPQAVEEIMRYESPTPVNCRRVTRDVVLHETELPAGSNLVVLNGSVNRDERHFADADRFSVERLIDRHLAFGYGAHYCIGQALARLEGKVAIRETLRRWPQWNVGDDGITWMPRNSSVTRGFTNVVIHDLVGV